jgi:hypothetical protein
VRVILISAAIAKFLSNTLSKHSNGNQRKRSEEDHESNGTFQSEAGSAWPI